MMNMETFILSIFIDQNTWSCPIEHREEVNLVMDIKLSRWPSVPGLSSDALCLFHGLLKRKDCYLPPQALGFLRSCVVHVLQWWPRSPLWGSFTDWPWLHCSFESVLARVFSCPVGRLLHGFCEYRTFGAKTGTSQGKWEPPHPAQPVMWVGTLLPLTMQNCADSLWLVSWWI